MQIGNHGHLEERILLLFNASADPVDFNLSKDFPCNGFRPVFSSMNSAGLYEHEAEILKAGEAFSLSPRSFVLLQHQT
jgi:hypothetical protein